MQGSKYSALAGRLPMTLTPESAKKGLSAQSAVARMSLEQLQRLCLSQQRAIEILREEKLRLSSEASILRRTNRELLQRNRELEHG